VVGGGRTLNEVVPRQAACAGSVHRPGKLADRTLVHPRGLPSINVSNILSEEKKQQIISLGKLGLSLRRIERTVDIRRETAAGYLKAAGIAIRPPGGWGRRTKPANEVITDFGAASAKQKVVPAEPRPGRSPPESTSQAYRELIVRDPQSGRYQTDFVSPLCRDSSLAHQSITSAISGTGLAIHGEVVLRQRLCHENGCHAVFWICRHCDRGQRYCSRACRTLARLQQRRSANRRHQRSLEGRLDHRDRQRRYRRRWAQARARVTGQASLSIVSPSSLRCGIAGEMLKSSSGSMMAEVPSSCEKASPSQACCIVCGRTGSGG